MKQCPLCHRWYPEEESVCPVDGAKLLNNEASSEDADDGKFEKPKDGDE